LFFYFWRKPAVAAASGRLAAGLVCAPERKAAMLAFGSMIHKRPAFVKKFFPRPTCAWPELAQESPKAETRRKTAGKKFRLADLRRRMPLRRFLLLREKFPH
jgi:hypothetical protein